MNRRKALILVICIVVCIIIITIFFLNKNKHTHKGETVNNNTQSQTEVKSEPTPEALIPTPDPTSSPKEEIIERLSDNGLISSAGDVYYSVYYFNTNKLYSYGISKKTPSASVIKVFIMQYVYSLYELGVISPKDKIKERSIDRLIHDMIQKSDNTATNIIIDKFGMTEINQFINNNGYSETVLERRMLDYDARKRGLENYTSLNDVMKFLKDLYNNRSTYPYNEMLEILKGQKVKTKIPLLLPSGTIVANKTGELEGIENDIGIVFMQKSDFAIAVLTNKSKNTANTRQEIGKLAREAFKSAEN